MKGHERCLAENHVILVARTRHIAEHFAQDRLPATAKAHYVGGPDDCGSVDAFCRQHVKFVLVGDWYMSESAESARAALVYRGFKQAPNG